MAVYTKKSLGEMLLEEGILAEEQYREVLKQQKESGESFEHVLVRLNYMTEEAIMAFLGMQLGIPHANAGELDEIPSEVLALVQDAVIRRHRILPFKRKNSTLTVALVDPTNVTILDELKLMTGLEIEPALAAESEILRAIEKLLGAAPAAGAASSARASASASSASGKSKEIKAAADTEPVTMDQLLTQIGETDEVEIVEAEKEALDLAALAASSEEAPVVKLVNFILSEAIRLGASDIHMEPFEKNVRLRFRVDGILHEQKAPPRKTYMAVVSRIKIMSELDIAERRLPQDGRIKIKIFGREVDLRVSIIPVLFGEKVVMRILENEFFPLEKLGFEGEWLEVFKRTIKSPWGMIVVCGPTGSGKSKTLSSTLVALNSPEVNISTVEDPVEFTIQGVNQVAAKADIGLTFAAGLRAFLRQDPNIIMVGETRDKETAEVGINAALTGHLVFSTLHTNDAPSAITRFTNMGVEPFLISSTLIMAVAQRLVRRVCPKCKEPYEASEAMLRELRLPPKSDGTPYVFYKGKGCQACGKLGYKGRMAAHEIMLVSEPIRSAVLNRDSADVLKRIARKQGMATLRDIGLIKALRGDTSVEEVLRETMGDEPLE